MIVLVMANPYGTGIQIHLKTRTLPAESGMIPEINDHGPQANATSTRSRFESIQVAHNGRKVDTHPAASPVAIKLDVVAKLVEGGPRHLE